MAYTHVLKNGKTVTTDPNGVTSITKVYNGKTVTKQYNMNNLHAGTVVGDGGHVKIGNGVVHIENCKGNGNPNYAAPNSRIGPAVPVGGIAGRANQEAQRKANPVQTHVYMEPTYVQQRQTYGNVQPPRVQQPQPPRVPVVNNPQMGGVKNQFNITGSVIGQVAIGNKGKTVFNNKTEQYNAGSSSTEYKIEGGNFAQANIGGEATYNNKNCVLGDGAGTGVGLSIEDLMYSNGIAESHVLEILKKGVSAANFMEMLKAGKSIDKIHGFVSKFPKVNDHMVRSMLDHDGMDTSSDDDTSDSDSD